MKQSARTLITSLSQLGFTNADFAAPTAGTVDRTTVALNFQKISNKIAATEEYKNATLNIVLNQSEFGNLFSSIVNGVFGNRAGISVRMNVLMEPRTDIKADQIVTFTQDLGGTTADGATNKITLSLAGTDTTTPKLVQTDNYVSQHIATLMYTPEMDAGNAGKTFEKIFEELHIKRNQVSKAGVFVLPTTGSSFSQMWRAVKEKLGIPTANASTQIVEFSWFRSESVEYPTTVNVYERDTNRKRIITLIQTPSGFSAEEYKVTATALNGLTGVVSYAGYSQTISAGQENTWVDFAPTKGTSTVLSSNSDTGITAAIVGDNSANGQRFIFKENNVEKQYHQRELVVTVDYSGSGITGSDTQALEFRLNSIGSGAVGIVAGDMNMFGRLANKVVSKSFALPTVSDSVSIPAGYFLQIRSTLPNIDITINRVRFEAIPK